MPFLVVYEYYPFFVETKYKNIINKKIVQFLFARVVAKKKGK